MKNAILAVFAAAFAALASGCYTKTVYVPVNGRGQLDRAYTVELYGNRIYPAGGIPPVPADAAERR